jgi:hypothetical protein
MTKDIPSPLTLFLSVIWGILILGWYLVQIDGRPVNMHHVYSLWGWAAGVSLVLLTL